MHHHSIAKDVLASLVKHATRQEMEGVLHFFHHNCMASVGAAIKSGAHVVILGKDVNELSFALVSPLRAQNDAELRVQPRFASKLPRGSRQHLFGYKLGYSSG